MNANLINTILLCLGYVSWGSWGTWSAAPKPAVAEHRIVNGNVKFTVKDTVIAQAQMKRPACVTHYHVLLVGS